MVGKVTKETIKVIATVIVHLICILGMCVVMFFTFVLGPYDDHFMGQRIISQYRLEICTESCLIGIIVNAVLAWLSFKKARLVYIAYIILGIVFLLRFGWLLTLWF